MNEAADAGAKKAAHRAAELPGCKYIQKSWVRDLEICVKRQLYNVAVTNKRLKALRNHSSRDTSVRLCEGQRLSRAQANYSWHFPAETLDACCECMHQLRWSTEEKTRSWN